MQLTKKLLAGLALLTATAGAGVLGIAAAHEGGEGKADRGARRAEILAKYDANKDGALDENERKAMIDDLAAQRFAKLDTNRDGVLSLDEFKAGFGHMRHHGHGRFGHKGDAR